MSVMKTEGKKFFILLIISFVIGYWLSNYKNKINKLSSCKQLLNDAQFPPKKWTTAEREVNLSILSKWLQAPEGTPPPALNAESALNPEKRLLVLVWQWGAVFNPRLITHPSLQGSISSFPLEGCSVKTCDLSRNDTDLARADAVVFYLQWAHGRNGLPPAKGKPGQIWIFSTGESPFHTFFDPVSNHNISQYNGIFDWSMNYRRDSDVPLPYGRTIARKEIDDNERQRLLQKRRKKLVAIMGSNCAPKNRRWEYVKELKNILGEQLDIFGRCLEGNTTACPGNFSNDCPILDAYKFYLAFENSHCREYITEKLFWNAYAKGSVPVIMGAPQSDCERLLPPRSFIYAANFPSPSKLADYLRYLDDNDDAYDEYHAWRSSYIVLNEHGYFGSASKHLCRLCEALRYNILPSGLPKYQRMGDFLNLNLECTCCQEPRDFSLLFCEPSPEDAIGRCRIFVDQALFC